MRTKEDIIESLRGHKGELEAGFATRRIGLFGSFAHGTPAPGSVAF